MSLCLYLKSAFIEIRESVHRFALRLRCKCVLHSCVAASAMVNEICANRSNKKMFTAVYRTDQKTNTYIQLYLVLHLTQGRMTALHSRENCGAGLKGALQHWTQGRRRHWIQGRIADSREHCSIGLKGQLRHWTQGRMAALDSREHCSTGFKGLLRHLTQAIAALDRHWTRGRIAAREHCSTGFKG